MKKIFFKTILFLLIFTCSAPSFAENWDYILEDYPNNSEQKIVKEYLNEFDKTLKDSWYTPLYRRQFAKYVMFYLNKDGTITVEKIVHNPAFKEPDPYNKSFEKYIKEFFSEYKFKSFPQEMKNDKVRLVYALIPNRTAYYMMAGYGAIVINKSSKDFLTKNNFN